MAGVTLTDSGVGLFIAVLRPSTPVVVQRIAGEEGCLIRRALGAQTADCAGLVIDCLFGTGCSRLQILRLCFFSREAVCQHLAVFAVADRADSLVRAGRRAAVAILGFRMAGVTLTDSGVGLFIAVLRPSAPVVVQRIAEEEGRLIRRALGAQTADCAGLVVDRLFRAGGGGFQVLCIHGLRREVVGQLFAILSLAYLADGFCGAGCRAAGVFRLIKHRAAGADLPVFRFVGFPVVALVVMGVALSIEHGQGLARCIQILAFVCPRVSIVVAFASLEQLPHRAVGKFCGGLGVGSIDINTVRSAGWVSCRQIVAVIDSGASRAEQIAYNFARTVASVQTADIITVGNQNIYVATIRLTCDSTGISAGDHSDIIAVTNCCVYSSSVVFSSASDSSADSTGEGGA